MESKQEIERLERKTNIESVQQQARWAGLQPGMRVADIGCGSGKTTYALYQAVLPGGQAVGLDLSRERLAFAVDKYKAAGLEFVCQDVSESLDELAPFDFIWIRFFLEYHRTNAFRLVKHIVNVLKPGGILCLIDLDYNCLSHFEMPLRLDQTLRGIMEKAEREIDFDSRMGIKLYSFLYDLGFQDINVSLDAHHLIYGELKEVDAFNWAQKVDIAARRSGYSFVAYPGGFDEFKEEFHSFFSDPRRFTYSPIILCRGYKPLG